MSLRILTNAYCLFFLLLASSFSLQQSDNIICWSKDRKLTWDDFTKKYGLENAAESNVIFFKQITYKGRATGLYDTVVVETSAIFNKSKSFLSPGSETPILLQHEQGHFDIAEIHARKFRKILMEYIPIYNDYRLMLYIEENKDKIKAENNAEDNLYDEETDHHNFEGEQQRWTEKIGKELKELEHYSDNSTIRIFIKR